MQFNWLIILLAALVPMAMGFIWYHPKVFGTAWMVASGTSEEKMKSANMGLVFGLSFFFSFLISMSLQFNVIHQFHYYSILMNEPGIMDPTSTMGMYAKDFMEKYGENFRTFKHGALHGTLTGIFLIFPIVAIGALFERRSFKYIFISAGYWIVSFLIMGGILSAYAK